jgi:hypothetical protein
MHVAGLQIVYDRCAGCDVHKGRQDKIAQKERW